MIDPLADRRIVLVARHNDNVATAITDGLNARLECEVWTYEGQANPPTLALETHVPRYFKVAIRDLEPGDEIFKWGRPIGRASFEIVEFEGGPRTQVAIPRGTVVHLGNFSPSRRLVRWWNDNVPIGGAEQPFAAVAAWFAAESPQSRRRWFPYQISTVSKQIGLGAPIYRRDIQTPQAGMGSPFLPSDDCFLGLATREIAAGASIHLGCVADPDKFEFKPEFADIVSNAEADKELLSKAYQFFRKKIYGAQ